MAEPFTVIVSDLHGDAALASALAARCTANRVEAMAIDSQRLVEFFEPAMQRRLPAGYDLAFCGHRVVHTDWDGRLVRPRLMDRLRGHFGPIRWFCAGEWLPEDRRALEQLIGVENLVVSEESESTTALVSAECAGADDDYAKRLERVARGVDEKLANRLRRCLGALKASPLELASSIMLLAQEKVQEVLDTYLARAEDLEERIEKLARDGTREPMLMGELKLARVALPPWAHFFWSEASARARAHAEAELALCRLEGRPTLVLTRQAGLRLDLRTWARYVTDLMPEVRSVEASPEAVPLVVAGLPDTPGLMDEVLRLMGEGAHLLRQ